jgi:solute carrier family 25 carnitine/acylcarnitine transporter 20/29
VKVRLQNQGSVKAYDGMVDCATKLLKNEGPLGFYKGTLPPLLGVGACVSILFAAVENTKRLLMRLNGENQLSTYHYFIAGGIGGLCNAVVIIPVEHVRIKMQIQNIKLSAMSNVGSITGSGINGPVYSGSIDCAKKILQSYGLKGLYKGTPVTCLREMICNSSYFFTYETILRSVKAKKEKGYEQTKLLTGIAGALSGFVYWIIGFPVDVTKTRIQADSLSNPKFSGLVDCVRQNYRENGLKGFYKGFGPCMLRAAPVNAGNFIVYENTMKYFKRKF